MSPARRAALALGLALAAGCAGLGPGGGPASSAVLGRAGWIDGRRLGPASAYEAGVRALRDHAGRAGAELEVRQNRACATFREAPAVVCVRRGGGATRARAASRGPVGYARAHAAMRVLRAAAAEPAHREDRGEDPEVGPASTNEDANAPGDDAEATGGS